MAALRKAGNNITVSPAVTTTYYGRHEDALRVAIIPFALP
jgi:hypothetical protein